MYQVNFLSWRHQLIARKKRQFLILFLAASCVVIMVLAYFISYQQSEYQRLQFSKAQLQQQATQNQQLIQSITKKQTQLKELVARQQLFDKQTESNLSLLNFFQQLPELTPKKSWLSGFSLKDNQVEIKANSYDFRDISQLVVQLENSQLLNKIQLVKMGKIKEINYLHLSANYQESSDE
ncbi:PilN domain-containing protein [Providencia burhodogranariea]|uniref:Fimbrial assembly protein n=1 Tax=Providencia burhodogranariea DSM 19968 TaxID=1141662 RepID=K8WIR3_9GAMM|nr:hypothetical protein OOA_15997 [Providencia burhodogranariea DSM 19968]